MKDKKLAIITDCIHMYDKDGNVVTENHIFRKQIQAIAAMFSETLICCPFDTFSNNKVASVYCQNNIRFVSLPNVGGSSIKDKLKLISTISVWLRAFKKADKFADIVYQRFPNNVNIPGGFYFFIKRKNVFATYTGTWKNYKGEPLTYRLQKWFLRRLFRGPVFIYTEKEPTGKKLIKSFSPSFTNEEWLREEALVEKKIAKLKSNKIEAPVFITVGSLQHNKNQQYILNAFKILNEQNFLFKLFIVGDGPLKDSYHKFINDNNLADKVVLTGKKTDVELKELYRQSDFIIQAPIAEGFGKVPIEGFCHGIVPILSATALAGEMIGNNHTRGYLFKLGEVNTLVSVIKKIELEQHKLPAMIQEGRIFVQKYTIDNWVGIFSKVLH